jgi:hypothetical protein
MAFIAKYPGECVFGDSIEPGDLITGNDTYGYQHVTCDEKPGKPIEICSKCYMQKPCDCE